MSEEERSESAVSRSQSIKEDEMAEEKEAPKKVSRKDFVKGAAAVAGAGALASCAPAAPPAATSVPAPTRPPAVECAPCPSVVPETWDQEADVVVVGSGGAGLCAAIEAARAGAGVLVLEKGFYPGGNALLSGGHCILGATHVQAQLGIEDDAEWWYEDQMAWGEHRAVPELMSVYTKLGDDLTLFMEELGLVWEPRMRESADARVPRGHWPAQSPDYTGGWPAYGGISHTMVEVKELERLGVPILLNHKMTRIYRVPNGPVVGVEVETEGKTINIKARTAVLLGSGGFKANTQMRMAYDPRLDTDLWAGGLPYVDTFGEASNAALDIGAAETDMSYVCELRIRWGTRTYQLWEPPTFASQPAGAGLGAGDYSRLIIVKNDGQRYFDETSDSSLAGAPFYEEFLNLKERPRNVWAVTDEEGAAALNWSLGQFENPEPEVLPCLYPGNVAVADSLQELATEMGIPAAALEATVSKYNGFVDAGEDADFGKPLPLYKVAKPPFFGAKLLVLCHDQMGGLRANSRAQVLDRADQIVAQGVSIDEEKVIPHLYAAGECVGGYVGKERGSGKLGVYMIWGRIAGENAAKETPWE